MRKRLDNTCWHAGNVICIDFYELQQWNGCCGEICAEDRCAAWMNKPWWISSRMFGLFSLFSPVIVKEEKELREESRGKLMVSLALSAESQQSLGRAAQLLWSRSALILHTWFSLSVFQAPRKMLAAVLTWQIPSQPNGAHGRHALWIVDSSDLWSAFHMRPSELNALPLLSFKAIWQEGCDAAPGLFHGSLPFLRRCLAVELFPCSALIVHSFAPSLISLRRRLPVERQPWGKRTSRYSNC